VNVPERQPRCRTSSIAEKIKPAEFEKTVRQPSKNESFLPVDGLPLADKRTWLSKLVESRKGLLAALIQTPAPISAIQGKTALHEKGLFISFRPEAEICAHRKFC
jgi:hypothetical protein